MKSIPVRRINTTQKEPVFYESFIIRDVQQLLGGRDMIQELHRHDFFFILALKKGRGEHTIDFTPCNVTDHSVSIMRPGQVHQLTLKAGSTGYLIQFNPDFYLSFNKLSNELLRKASSKNACQLNADKFKKIHTVLTTIFQEQADKQEGYQEVIKANLSIFFIELTRQRGNPSATSNPLTSYAQERMEEFLALLETHVASHKQVSQYADMLHLSPYQLNAITKSLIGKTCSALINEHILLEAKRHLLATANQINQIAYHLGYEDVSYFIRFFKKHTGHSPEAFRHNSK